MIKHECWAILHNFTRNFLASMLDNRERAIRLTLDIFGLFRS